MAKQIKRFGPAVFLIALIGIVLIVPFAQSDPPGSDGNPAIAMSIRRAVAFGPVDCLPALVNNNAHRAMIDHARSFVADHETELAPLVANHDSARDALVRAITSGQEIDTARQNLESARLVIVTAITDMMPGLGDHIPPPLQAYIDMVLANAELDPDLRALSLTTEQREAVLAAQHERDTVTQSARNWYQPVRKNEAVEVFEETLDSILIQPQRNQLSSLRQTLASRHEEMMIAETEPFTED